MDKTNIPQVDHDKYMFSGTEHVPIYRKINLTTREAAEYSNIGINKIDSMLRSPNCPFVLFVGTKKLVKRKAFEEYISRQLAI
jgi:excisionase family DNA binding protein